MQIKIILLHQQIKVETQKTDYTYFKLSQCKESIYCRRALLQAIVEEHQVDIVIGCESHLDDTYLTQEEFPSDYGVIRKDRNSSGGGVFLA